MAKLYFYYASMNAGKSATLRARLDRGELQDETQVLAVAWQISHAMAFLHQLGLVHRDLKPDNILMNKSAEVRLIDFSLAIKVANDFNADDKALLKTNIDNIYMAMPQPLRKLRETRKLQDTPKDQKQFRGSFAF